MTITLAVELLLALLSKSAEISALIAKLQVEGRSEFTPEEWASIIKADDDARQRLVDAIAAAKLRDTPVA
jgi:hypothetical protein